MITAYGDDVVVAELLAPMPYGTTSNEAEYGGAIMGLEVRTK